MWNKDEEYVSIKKNKNSDLKALIGNDEKILYEGKPKKACFIFESIFNPMLPVALIWAIIDFTLLGTILYTDNSVALFVVAFLLLHLMPVWIYLFGFIFSFRRYRNTYYIVTERGIYTSGGIFAKHYVSKPFAELSHIDLHRGIFDQMFNVGDIVATSNQFATNNNSASIRLDSISDYENVYKIVKKLQNDVYADVVYPNDLRPKTNHGYKTKYDNKE